MTIHWTPIRSDRSVTYSQPTTDVLAINGEKLDFTDPAIVEFDIPDEWRDYVQEAHREDGELHLRLLAHYRGGNALSEEVTRKYGIGELTW